MATRLLSRPPGGAGLLASPLLAARPAQFCRQRGIDGTTARFQTSTDQATGRVADVLRRGRRAFDLFPAERRGYEPANDE